MPILLIILISYLSFGVVYALFILFRGADPWYTFPINVVGGPIVVLHVICATLRGKSLYK